MKTETDISFGKRIAALRKAAGLTQERLATKCRLNRTYIGSIERGEKSATLNTVDKLARGLGTTISRIFADGPESR